MQKYIIVIAIFLLSCTENEPKRITYALKDNVITRFDKDRVSYFFFGDKQSIDTTENYVLCRHTHGTDLMDAYLVFNLDYTVDLVKVAGEFEKYGSNGSIRLVDFSENLKFISWQANTMKNPFNVFRVDDVLKIEKAFNDTLNTSVKAIYY